MSSWAVAFQQLAKAKAPAVHERYRGREPEAADNGLTELTTAMTTIQVVWFWMVVALSIIFLVIALVLAAQCGGGWRQYLPAVLDPWVYIILRIANPC